MIFNLKSYIPFDLTPTVFPEPPIWTQSTKPPKKELIELITKGEAKDGSIIRIGDKVFKLKQLG